MINSADYKESLHDCKPEKLNLYIEFEPLFLTQPKESTLDENFGTFSFLESLISTSFDETNAKLDIILTSATNYLTSSPSLRSKKSFEPVNRKLSS